MAKQVGDRVSFDLEDYNCGCPSGYIKVGNICERIDVIQPTPPSQPITLAKVGPNPLYITYGAIIYEDITLKQWPIIATPQGGLAWTLSTNTPIPASGPNPNPFIPGGAPYTSLNPGTDGVNYTGGIGVNGEHAKVIAPVPTTGWPAIPLPSYTLNGRALRESTITGGVLNYGIGNAVQPQFHILSAPWKDGLSNANNWFNNQGVDASGCPYCVSSPSGSCYVCAKWYGFTSCVVVNSTKTYYVAVAANNAFRFKMDGNLVVEFNVADGLEPTLSTASIFPITLPAGTHVFQVEMLNYSGDGGMVFEIYDCSLAQLQAVTNLAELEAITIFSTSRKIGEIYDVSNVETQGYSCAEGYIYSNCDDSPQCIKIDTVEPLKTNVKLTPCCGDTSIVHVVSHEQFLTFPLQEGSTACIEDINPNIGCWLTEETCDLITYTQPFTVKGTFADCFKCLAECRTCDEPCKACPPGYTLSPSGVCEGLESVPAVLNNIVYTADLGSFNTYFYATNPAEFYEDITLKPWPIKAVNGQCTVNPYNTPSMPGICSFLQDNTNLPLNVSNYLANAVWGGVAGSNTNFRLKKSGLWTYPPGSGLPTNEWIGWSYCVDIAETKTYYVAFASDDACKISLDGVLMIDHTAGWSFRSWKVVPVTISAGKHIFEARVINSLPNSDATLGFEIYDATLAQLLAVAAPGDLDPYIVFTTADYIGEKWQIGTSSGYTCPEGYALNTCDGFVCSRITTTGTVDCCFAIKDCKTDEEVFLVTYTEPNNPSLPDLLTLVTAKTVIGDLTFIGGPEEGCFYFDTAKGDCEAAVPYSDVTSFTQYATCKECTDKCFLLTNCLDSQETIVTNTDLSQYVNYVVSIKGCKDQCWIVTEGAACEDCTQEVIVLTAFPPKFVGGGGSDCTYACADVPLTNLCYLGVTWTVNDEVVLDGPYNTLEDIVGAMSALNLGTVTLEGTTIRVIGTESYSNLFFSFGGPFCEVPIPNVSVTPVCQISPLTPVPDCEACLPQPVVVVQPLLNTRAVKPGYKTPGCSPEYTEKVNCAFGQAMNKQMLSVRYGLNTCCDETDTNWEIKKELLDFEAIKDTNLTPCNNEL